MRAFSLLELMVVVVISGILAASAIATLNIDNKRKEQATAEQLAALLRVQRLKFVNDGTVAMRIVPKLTGGAEVRWLTGACGLEAGGGATLDSLFQSTLPLAQELCVDRYGRATTPAMVPVDTSVQFTTTPVAVTWDQNGRIFVKDVAEDAVVRPRVDNLASLNTPDPTPGLRPTTAVQMQPGVMR